jgi:hypothetical protein
LCLVSSRRELYFPREKKMKRISLIMALFGLGFTPAAQAQYHEQEHAEVGAYIDYFHLQATGTDFAGLGGRLGFNVAPHAQLEAEMSYDFNQVFSEGFTNPSSGIVSVAKSNLRVVHGLFGPKFQTGGPVRLFVTVKGGFDAFRFDTRPATFSTFGSTVENLRTDNVNGVLYPGAGVEAFLGPVGLRLDVGDEIYFAHGAHNNLRISIGPTIRF